MSASLPKPPQPSSADPTDDTPGAITQSSEGTTQAGLGPLDALQLTQVEQASARLRGIRTAVGLARFNGVALWVCAALCVPLALLDGSLLAMALLLGIFGTVELRGATALRALEPKGARMLAGNQLAILAVIGLYCLVSIYSGVTGPSPYETLLAEYPDLQQMLAGSGVDDAEALGSTIEGAYRAGIVVFYLLVFFLAGVYQGACAYYYHSRGKALRGYLADTPAWVRELQRRLG